MGRISRETKVRSTRSPMAIHIGQQLLALRDQSHLTMHAIKDQTGLAVSTLSSVENGVNMPSVETLFILAQVFGVTLDRFLEGYKP